MKNYEEMYQVTTAAVKIANALRTDKNLAITECDTQGVKLTRTSKDLMTIYVHFLFNNKICKMRIRNEETGIRLTYKIPDEVLPGGGKAEAL